MVMQAPGYEIQYLVFANS